MKERRLTRAQAIIGGFALIAALARFGSLSTPLGFAIDEGGGAAHALCIAEGGTDSDGRVWPIFSKGLGGGLYTPHYMYLTAAWSTIFGGSTAAFRGFVAFVGFLSVLFLAALARRLGGPQAAFYTFVAASLSPWAFQFSRVAWDPALAPFFLIVALWCLVKRERTMWIVLAGFFLASCAYVYPPQRLQVVLVIGLIWFFAADLHIRRRHVVLATVVSAVFALPLIYLTLQVEMQGRHAAVGVFGSSRAVQHLNLLSKLVLVLDNFWLHLRPGYFLFFGDRNPRHSNGFTGIASYWDLFVLLLLIGCAGVRRQAAKSDVRMLTFCLLGFASGVLPAALTWNGLPHALRSIGAWPFLSLGVGLSAALLAPKVRWFDAWSAVVASCSAVVLVVAFFIFYPERDETVRHFDGAMYRDAQRLLKVERRPDAFMHTYSAHKFLYLSRYYLMTMGSDNCISSRRRSGEGRSR